MENGREKILEGFSRLKHGGKKKNSKTVMPRGAAAKLNI